MQNSRAFVFKEIQTQNETYYQWYKLLDEPREKEYIEPGDLLLPYEHWERLGAD